MIRYVIKRILMLIPTIIGVSLLVFILLDLAPGNIVDNIFSESAALSAEDMEALIQQYDLDKPMIYRYGKYMLNLIQGNLGASEVSNFSVWDEYMRRLPNTLLLSFTSLIIGALVAIPLGIFAARRAGRLADNATTVFTLIGVSMPVFWLGLLLLQLFSLRLGWLPAGGNRQGILSLILPAFCSALTLMATATRQTRSSMLEVLHADYLRTARAKGVPEEVVIRKHALGNGWIPILTVLGNALGISLAGAVVVETVFTWPGVGRMAADAVRTRDVTTVLGCIIMTSILIVLVQIIVDLLYSFADPRIKSRYLSVSNKRKKAARPATKRAAPKEVPAVRMEASASASSAVEEPDKTFEAPVQESLAAASAPQPENAAAAAVKAEAGPAYPQVSMISDDRQRGKDEIKPAAAEDRDQTKVSNPPLNKHADMYQLVTRKYKKRSMIAEIFHRLKKNKGAVVGFAIFSILILICLASLFISYDAITAGNPRDRLTSPNLQHPFGTDNLGRDAFTRVIYGTRYSLIIGLGGSVLSAFFGIALGAIAGYYGKKADNIIMRFADIIWAIPNVLLGMVIVTVLGTSLVNLIIAVGVTTIPIYVRITRASVLSIRGHEFIEAAHAIGLSNFRIILRQVVPNSLSPVIVTFTINFGIMVIAAASLSYMGFGVPIPLPEWGSMISTGRDFARSAPYLMMFPGIFIMITVLGINLIGDGLRDALDPKLKGRR